jgi:subtilisin family serine protease
MDRYIVLRDENQTFLRPGTGPLIGPGVRFGAESVHVEVPPAPALEAHELSVGEAAGLAQEPGVLGIARSMPTRLIAPLAGNVAAAAGPTWGVTAVGAAASPFDGAGVKVCVLDTGIDAAHPAFQGVNLTQRDFTGSGNGDVQGHGTHCAGTVFGRDVDGTRIGVARGVTEALIGKVLGNDGSGTSEMLFEGLKWASGENAKVVSMSLGFDFPGLVDRLIQQGMPNPLAASIALEAYRANLRVFDSLMAMFRAMTDFNGGLVVVAASGNESERQIAPDFEVSASLPAAADGVVSVGAVGESAGGLVIADFSNTNPTLAAPGVNVLSAKSGGGLVAFRGTSMACPHVAGVAALWWQALRQANLPLTHRTVEARLTASAARAGFAAGVDATDRGQGLAQAPMAAIA